MGEAVKNNVRLLAENLAKVAVTFITFMRDLLKTDLIIERSEGGNAAWEVNPRFEESLKYLLRDEVLPN